MTERSRLKRESFKGKEKGKEKKERKRKRNPSRAIIRRVRVQRGCARDAIARAAPLWRDGIPRYPPRRRAIKPAHVHRLPETPVSFFLPRIREFTQRCASSLPLFSARYVAARKLSFIPESHAFGVTRTRTHIRANTRVRIAALSSSQFLSTIFYRSFLTPAVLVAHSSVLLGERQRPRSLDPSHL